MREKPQPHMQELQASLASLPWSKLVLQTSNSAVAGLPMLTAVLPSSCRLKNSKFSEREHKAQVKISVKPHMEHSIRRSSTS